MYNILIVL